ncbi:MAG: TonB-dependent receptor [Pedobacter sp.]
MKSQLNLKKALSTLLFVILGVTAFAQTGRISGKVSDKKSGETLIGVTVKIKGSTTGMATDVDGKYSLPGLAAGKYILIFQYVGYNGKEISDVEVTSGKTTVFDIVLDETGGENLSEVVIQGSFKKESVNALYAQQKNSAVISDGISSDVIRKSPDRSTGDVLKRVSGTTIQDNKFVIVRGLADRYNNASLDNSSLPSTEPNKKAFSFDIVPSGLINNIVVYKTATPDLAADFAGGSIKIVTKDVPESNFFELSLGTGYNSQSTFKDFSYGPRYTENYFGFDGGYRQLPTGGFPKNTNSTEALRGNQAATISAINKLPKVWKIGNHDAPLAQNHQFSMGRVKDFKNGGKFGAIVALTYRNSETTRPVVERSYYTYDYDDRVNTFSSNIGAMANFAYVQGKNKISFKNLYNRILDDKFTYRTGTDVGRSSDLQYYAFDVIQKGIFKTSLDGDHQLTDKNKLSWTASYANITNNQPDQRKIGYLRNVGFRDDPTKPFLAANTAITKENNRFFSDLNESLYGGAVNDSYSIKLFDKNATLKGGLGANYRTRDFGARLLGITLKNADQDIQALPVSQLYSKSLINSGVYELSEITGNSDKYDANSLVSFGYAMLDQPITDKLRAVYGVRVEQFNLKLNSRNVDGTPLHVNQDYLDILPSVNLTYALSERANFRASYYRTLARPEFRELAPFDYYDYELLGNVAGNPSLKRTLIDNADLRYEIYPSAGQIFSVSAFYKHFDNAIEPSIYDQNSTPAFSYFNTKSINNYGVELEIRQSLAFIDDESILKDFMISANGTLVKSKVINPTDQVYLTKERPMVGQSPYAVNAGIQYSALDNSLNFSALYNRIGRRITNAGGQRFGDVWEAPRNVIDFQTSYSFYKKKAQLKLNVNDLLNNQAVFYFDYNKDKKFSPNNIITNSTTGEVLKDEILSRYKTGTNVSLSLTYTF